MSIGSVNYKGVQLKQELEAALAAWKPCSASIDPLGELESALNNFLTHKFCPLEHHFVFSSTGDTTKIFVGGLLEAREKANAQPGLRSGLQQRLQLRRLDVKVVATVYLTVSQAKPFWKLVPDLLQQALQEVQRLQTDLLHGSAWVQHVQCEQEQWEIKRQQNPRDFAGQVGLYDSIRSTILFQGHAYREKLLRQHQSQQSTCSPGKNRYVLRLFRRPNGAGYGC
jgi:hypothetical protein